MSERVDTTVRPEFFIDRSGRPFVLFAGLLDAAHRAGLLGITTDLIQIPHADNGFVAICRAVVEMEDGCHFSGIGDAAASNVGKNIAPHIVRMAETRAKARALRDAINVGTAAVEELGGDDEPAATPTRPWTQGPVEPPRVVPVGHAVRPPVAPVGPTPPAVPFEMPTNAATGQPYTGQELRLRYRQLVDKADTLGIAHRQLPADAPLGAVAETAKGLHRQIQASEAQIPMEVGR